MAETLQIHQALYGYQDGHRLLASSVDLPPPASRSILPLSDGPDLQVKVPPAGYLSGYPVSPIDAFALSMTWPAPEMPRPGCVWTHVLFIGSRELRSIFDPRGLLHCFRRPEGPDPDRLPYLAPLSYREAAAEGDSESGMEHDLLYWLYRSDEPLVFRGADRPAGERSLLGVWGQQWPELRQSFSFISIPSTRQASSRPFDVRLVFGSDPVLERALGADIHASSDLLPSDEDWIAQAVHDVASPGLFREVLWHYGPEAGDQREAFAPIARVLAAERGEGKGRIEDAERLLEIVGLHFPRPHQMRGLKKDLFGPAAVETQLSRVEGAQLRWGGSDAAILFALAASPEQSALDGGDLELGGRAEALWSENRSRGLELLQRCAEESGQPVARSILDALLPLAACYPDLVTSEAPAAVPLAIDRDPSFAANTSVWRGSEPDIERRWGVLNAIPSLGTARKEIVKALVGSGAPSGVQRAFSRWGSAIVADLLEIAGEPAAPQFSQGWTDIVRANPDAVAEWLGSRRTAPRRRQMELVAECADPEQIAHLGLPLSPWSELLDDSHRGGRLSPTQTAFLFRLGLASPDPSAAYLMREAFVPLLDALHGDPLAWRLFPGEKLKTKLKSNGKSIQIGRPTMALVERWRERGWPVAALLEVSHDPAVVAEIVAAYAQSKSGTKEVEHFLSSLHKKRDSKLLDAVPSDLRPKARKG